MLETRVRSLGWEDPLEKGIATHSSILAWRIPRIAEDLPNPGKEPGSPALQAILYHLSQQGSPSIFFK